jgi:hypothetical protein
MEYEAKSEGQNFFEPSEVTGNEPGAGIGEFVSASPLVNPGETEVSSGAGPSLDIRDETDLEAGPAARGNCLTVESKVPDSVQDDFWAPYTGNDTP